MKLASRWTLTITFWSCVLSCAKCSWLPKNSSKNERDKGENTVEEVLDSLSRLMEFLERDYEFMNLDGMYGFRVAQGQLRFASEFLSRHPSRFVHQRRRIADLERQASVISDRALPYLRQTDPEYFEKFRWTVEKPIQVPFISRRIDFTAYILGSVDSSLSSDIFGRDHYNEKRGDVCLTQLSNTDEKSKKHCAISENCLAIMTTGGTRGYNITHQLLYSIFAQTFGCYPLIERVLPSHDINQFQQQKCDAIFAEALQIARMSKAEGNRDIFLEQGLLCGMIGFVDFLRLDWLKMIRSWQASGGCYKDEDPDEEEAYEMQKAYLFRNLLRAKEIKELKKNLRSRKKTIRGDGCESHISGLAAGLLGVYLRVLLENNGSLDFDQTAPLF